MRHSVALPPALFVAMAIEALVHIVPRLPGRVYPPIISILVIQLLAAFPNGQIIAPFMSAILMAIVTTRGIRQFNLASPILLFLGVSTSRLGRQRMPAATKAPVLSILCQIHRFFGLLLVPTNTTVPRLEDRLAWPQGLLRFHLPALMLIFFVLLCLPKVALLHRSHLILMHIPLNFLSLNLAERRILASLQSATHLQCRMGRDSSL